MNILHPELRAIQIEINSHCNRKCLYCPNHDNVRPIAFLLREIYYKIISELKAINYKGRLTFNQFNEPLLDKRLRGFIEYTREELPKAFIYLNTNGDFLDIKLWQDLRQAGLNFAHIMQYNNKVNDNIAELVSKLDENEHKHYTIKIFDPATHADNRAGSLRSIKNIPLPLKMPCPRPFYQMCIDYRGKAVLCCEDYLSAVIVGDIKTQNIMEIWQGETLISYREKLASSNRELKLCDKCDKRDGLKYLPDFELVDGKLTILQERENV